MSNSQVIIKVVLLGDSAVGKTSIALNIVKDQFNENQEATVGALYLNKTVEVDNMCFKFDIWDTAGQERYKSLTPMYYRGAHAAIIVYDITNRSSFTRANNWIAELNEITSTVKTIILVGNKCDLSEHRVIDSNTAQKFADENNLLFIETSAKLSINIKEIFILLARKYPKSAIESASNSRSNNFSIEKDQVKTFSCCA